MVIELHRRKRAIDGFFTSLWLSLFAAGCLYYAYRANKLLLNTSGGLRGLANLTTIKTVLSSPKFIGAAALIAAALVAIIGCTANIAIRSRKKSDGVSEYKLDSNLYKQFAFDQKEAKNQQRITSVAFLLATFGFSALSLPRCIEVFASIIKNGKGAANPVLAAVAGAVILISAATIISSCIGAFRAFKSDSKDITACGTDAKSVRQVGSEHSKTNFTLTVTKSLLCTSGVLGFAALAKLGFCNNQMAVAALGLCGLATILVYAVSMVADTMVFRNQVTENESAFKLLDSTTCGAGPDRYQCVYNPANCKNSTHTHSSYAPLPNREPTELEGTVAEVIRGEGTYIEMPVAPAS